MPFYNFIETKMHNHFYTHLAHPKYSGKACIVLPATALLSTSRII